MWCHWSSCITSVGPSGQPQTHGQVPISILLLTHLLSFSAFCRLFLPTLDIQ